MQPFITSLQIPRYHCVIAVFAATRVGSQRVSLARFPLRMSIARHSLAVERGAEVARSNKGNDADTASGGVYSLGPVVLSYNLEMHRRVTHTVAAVIPRTYSTDRLARLQDPARVVTEESNYYGAEHVYTPRQDSSEISGYDLTTHNDDGQQHWRRLDSRGESILSGLDGPGEEEHDRMRRSPESMLQGGSLNSVAEESPDPPAPTDSNNQQLEPEDIQVAIEWELEENGLYGGES